MSGIGNDMRRYSETNRRRKVMKIAEWQSSFIRTDWQNILNCVCCVDGGVDVLLFTGGIGETLLILEKSL